MGYQEAFRPTNNEHYTWLDILGERTRYGKPDQAKTITQIILKLYPEIDVPTLTPILHQANSANQQAVLDVLVTHFETTDELRQLGMTHELNTASAAKAQRIAAIKAAIDENIGHERSSGTASDFAASLIELRHQSPQTAVWYLPQLSFTLRQRQESLAGYTLPQATRFSNKLFQCSQITLRELGKIDSPQVETQLLHQLDANRTKQSPMEDATIVNTLLARRHPPSIELIKEVLGRINGMENHVARKWLSAILIRPWTQTSHTIEFLEDLVVMVYAPHYPELFSQQTQKEARSRLEIASYGEHSEIIPIAKAGLQAYEQPETYHQLWWQVAGREFWYPETHQALTQTYPEYFPDAINNALNEAQKRTLRQKGINTLTNFTYKDNLQIMQVAYSLLDYDKYLRHTNISDTIIVFASQKAPLVLYEWLQAKGSYLKNEVIELLERTGSKATYTEQKNIALLLTLLEPSKVIERLLQDRPNEPVKAGFFEAIDYMRRSSMSPPTSGVALQKPHRNTPQERKAPQLTPFSPFKDFDVGLTSLAIDNSDVQIIKTDKDLDITFFNIKPRLATSLTQLLGHHVESNSTLKVISTNNQISAQIDQIDIELKISDTFLRQLEILILTTA